MKIAIQKQDILTTNEGIKYKIALQKKGGQMLFNRQEDSNFPAQLSSIGTDIRTDLNISWKFLEQICREANYSEHIDNLEVPEYCNKAITHCLLIMNWFVSHKFAQIFSQRIVSKIRAYQYNVSYEGIIHRIYVDSKVAIKDDKILFADIVGNSLFPCLFQKAIAKVFGSYEAIPDNLVQILELWSGYAIQNFAPSSQKPQHFLQFFSECFKNNNLVLFRTRNSVRLQSIGIISNSIFLIVRVLKISGVDIVQFLQLQGQKWKGRHSKKSQFWKGKEKQIDENKIVTGEGRENYIQINDLLGISRQIIFLHNTSSFHKNWIRSSPKVKHTFSLSHQGPAESQVLINVHCMKKNCRNSIYIIEQHSCELISGSFKQNKDKNFVAALLQPNRNYLLYVLSQNIEGKPIAVNVSVFSSASWCEIKEVTKNISVQQRSFLLFAKDIPVQHTYLGNENGKNQIKVKNLFHQFGLGLIIINLQPQFGKELVISIERQKLLQLGVQLVNKKELIFRHNGPCHSILIFKFKPKFKEGDCFPPVDTIRISLNSPGNEIRNIFHSL